MRHGNPPRDLSRVLAPEWGPRQKLTPKEKKRKAAKRRDSINSGPMISRDEKIAARQEFEAAYLAKNPPRLIKAESPLIKPSMAKRKR